MKQDRKPRSRIFIAGVCCIAATLIGSRVPAQEPAQEPGQEPAQGPLATVEAVERVVEKRIGQSGPWLRAKAGTRLGEGDALRTRKRSKADLIFADKSLVRLGALTTLEIQGVDSFRLQVGRILFSKVPSKQSARVVAGASVADIKGTVALIEVYGDGSAVHTLLTGVMTVSSIKGEIVELQAGQSVRTEADGSFSAIKSANPRPNEPE